MVGKANLLIPFTPKKLESIVIGYLRKFPQLKYANVIDQKIYPGQFPQ